MRLSAAIATVLLAFVLASFANDGSSLGLARSMVRTEQSVPGRSTIGVGGAPAAVAVGAGSVWVVVAAAGGERLLRLDPTSDRVRSAIRLGGQGFELGGVAVSAGAVWVAAGSRLFRIDPRQNRVVATILVGATATSVFAVPSAVWVTRAVGSLGQLVRVDPAANRIVARTSMGGGPAAVVRALGSVWVANSSPSSVMRIDPRTNKVVSTVLADRFSSSFAVAQGLLWVAGEGSAASGPPVVPALNANGRIVRQVQLPRAVVRLAAHGDQLWATDDCGCTVGRLLRIDLRQGQVTATYRVGQTPVAVTAGYGAVWVANFNSSAISRIGYRSR